MTNKDEAENLLDNKPNDRPVEDVVYDIVVRNYTTGLLAFLTLVYIINAIKCPSNIACINTTHLLYWITGIWLVIIVITHVKKNR